MDENLLEAPERGAIEGFLGLADAGFGNAPTYERLLGFLSGAVITPGGFESSDWLPSLFDLHGIVFTKVEDIEGFTASLVSLYNRIGSHRLREERLCPFDMHHIDLDEEFTRVIDWASGLHSAVSLQEDIWFPYEDEAGHVPEKLKNEVNLYIQCLGNLADPSSIPSTVPDPLPFQRNLMRECFDWKEEMFSETWTDYLLEMFRLFCLTQLDDIMDSLQRYSYAYDER